MRTAKECITRIRMDLAANHTWFRSTADKERESLIGVRCAEAANVLNATIRWIDGEFAEELDDGAH